jgi:hypothetical protein
MILPGKTPPLSFSSVAPSGKCYVCGKWFFTGQKVVRTDQGLSHESHTQELTKKNEGLVQKGIQQASADLPACPENQRPLNENLPGLDSTPNPQAATVLVARNQGALGEDQKLPADLGGFVEPAALPPATHEAPINAPPPPFPPREQMDQSELVLPAEGRLLGIDGSWTCNFCACANAPELLSCALCSLAKGLGAPGNSSPSRERWRCLLCTFEENHWESSHCAVCSNPRGEERLATPQEIKSQTDVPGVQEAESNPVDCPICCCSYEPDEMYRETECCSLCRSCMVMWVETQINGGNSLDLKCNCRSTKLVYSQLSSVFEQMSGATKEVYQQAKRKESLKSFQLFNCPDCEQENWVPPRLNNIQCSNPTCFSSGVFICVKHKMRHTRPDRDIIHPKPRRCAACVEECGGDGLLAAVLSEIQEAFCDRCPNCNGFVGGPESFDACLCLKCNHCPKAFCGFCYQYSGDWRDTHDHVRHCSKNPRVNYFVESEAVWHDLMRARRMEIGDRIIASSRLSMESAAEARGRMLALL